MLVHCYGFSPSAYAPGVRPQRAETALSANQFSAAVQNKKESQTDAAFGGLVIDVDEEVARAEPLHDLLYIERFAPEEKSESGLIWMPVAEDPPMHLGRVVSLGNGHVGGSGVVTPMDGVKVGDVVWLKHPWGIGPKDESFSAEGAGEDGEGGEMRRFSYMRYQDICGVVPP